MRIVDPSFEILDRRNLSVWQKLEGPARLAYKSEDKITEESAPIFCGNLFKRGHNATLEFNNFHFLIHGSVLNKLFNEEIEKFMTAVYGSKYIDIAFVYDEKSKKEDSIESTGFIVSGSLRAFIEGIAVEICDPKHVDYSVVAHAILSNIISIPDNFIYPKDFDVLQNHAEVCTSVDSDFFIKHVHPAFHGTLKCAVKFIVNRAVTHELVRHRPCSFLQESQRWCRYNQDKFGNEVTFIKPMFFQEDTTEWNLWFKAMLDAESKYLKLLETSSPQAARTVLPNFGY